MTSTRGVRAQRDEVPSDGRELLLSFYGDDFTGSTDVMEVLELAGIPTALYLRRPSPEDLTEDHGLRAVGFAGDSRTWTRARMDADLPGLFASMAALGALTFHYKICSTFDSAPDIGSIGRALEIARTLDGVSAIPMLIGSPDLGRYGVFGQLFARAAGKVHRLDRHPTLPTHPVTPMREADLLRHLSGQTDLAATNIDVLALDGPLDVLRSRYVDAQREAAVILFDILRAEHLPRIGELIWSGPAGPAPFVTGSSGIDSALVAYWRQRGWIGPPAPAPIGHEVPYQLILSGSCSEATRTQIEHVAERGAALIRLAAETGATPAKGIDAVAADAVASLAHERTVVVYTALGPSDCADPGRSAAIGEALAEVGARVLERARPPRLIVTGGDTSGRVAVRLGIEALRVLAPIAPGAPLCRARSRDQQMDGLEIALKGGQVGSPSYFEQVRQGHA